MRQTVYTFRDAVKCLKLDLYATLAVAVMLAGCASTGEPEAVAPEPTEEAPPYSDECGRAVEEAGSVGDMEDTVEDMDPAITACVDLSELEAAVGDFPDALDGVDLETVVSNRCLYSEDDSVLESAICEAVDP